MKLYKVMLFAIAMSLETIYSEKRSSGRKSPSLMNNIPESFRRLCWGEKGSKPFFFSDKRVGVNKVIR